MSAYWNTGAGYKTGAWHGLMPTFDERLTVTEAMEFGDMLYDYVTAPLGSWLEMPDGSVQHQQFGKKLGLWRMPTRNEPEPQLLRTTTKRYKILQNAKLGEILDPLTDIWPTDTVGVLHDWTLTFVTLKMEKFAVGGHEEEEHETWLAVSDDKGRPGSAFWGIVVKRIVCENTYAAAHASAKELTRIPHNSNVDLELRFRRDLALHAAQQREELLNQFNAMIKFEANKQLVEKILGAAFPYIDTTRAETLNQMVPIDALGTGISDMKEYATLKQEWREGRNEFADKQRTAARNYIGLFNEQHPYAANTLYGAFQGVTYVTSHEDLYRGNTAQQMSNFWFGGDRKESANAAFNMAVEIMKN